MIGDRCEACGIEWDKTMSEWTSDDRRSLIRGIERISSMLEERLPPLPKVDENEDLRASNIGLADTNVRLKDLYDVAQHQVEQLRTGNKRLSQNVFAANNRAEEARLKAASVTLEHDKLLLSHNKLMLKHGKLLVRLNNWIISHKCTCTIDNTCERCAVDDFVACDKEDE